MIQFETVTKKASASCPREKKASNPQSGQASVLLIAILGTFLLGSIAFAVDLSNMWFRRQAAQTAADASCLAGAMDMLYLQSGTISSSPGFTAGTAGDCSFASASAICRYAAFNGYTATSSASGWNAATPGGSVAVNWTFPATGSVNGVPVQTGVTNPFLKVVVRESVNTWFMGLLGISKMTVGASCTCGLSNGLPPPPMLILNPTIGSALYLSGGPHIIITGGPSTSIIVNSSANAAPGSNNAGNAVYCDGGNGNPIDTTTAGPAGTGAKLAIVGGPTLNQRCGSNYILASDANPALLWKSGVQPIADPYAGVPAPTQLASKVPKALTPVATVAQGYTPNSDATYGYINGTWVASGTDSCPNTAATHYLTYSSTYPSNGGNIVGSCLEFTPGYYPNGIDTTSLAGYGGDVVIFMPGIYYLNGNLNVGSSTTIRNAWVGTQPASQGVMFYFLSGGPLFAGGSGAANANITSVPSYYMNCSSSAPAPSVMPTLLTGNVLVSQCSTGGTYVGPPSSDSYSAAGNRGLLFFADHSNTYKATLFGAGASLSFTGALYFHNTNYADKVELNGAGSSTTYAIGNIVVDQLTLSGSGTIKMGLTGSSLSAVPQVSLFQ